MLSRDNILAVVDLDTESVHVKQWDGDVNVRGLTAKERDHFEASIGMQSNLENLRARLVVLCLVDDEGKRIFKDSDATALGEKNAQAINQLFEVCRKMSGMTDADVEELEGN